MKKSIEAELPEQENNDSENIQVWKELLREFNIIADKGEDPNNEKVKNKLFDIRERASNSPTLEIRQKDAIIARCDNYVKGTYGKDAVKEEYVKNLLKKGSAEK